MTLLGGFVTKQNIFAISRVVLVAAACIVPAIASADQVTLTDSSGLQYFVNENITFSTTSSASGAMSEASYTHAVGATTAMGGTSSNSLNDMFDGYLGLALTQDVSLTSARPGTGIAGLEFFRNNGVSAVNSCSDREISFPTQLMLSNFNVTRRVYVPADDTFARHLESVTNITGTEQTVYVGFGNNLGSDSNTAIVTSSSGDDAVTLADTWVTTFQNFSGTTSSDPRIGHVLQGEGTLLSPVMSVNFANGDDNPYWWYALVIPPGKTARILTFVTGQPSKAAAASKAAELAALHANPRTLVCITATERTEIRNFNTTCALDADTGTACDDSNLCTAGETCTALNTCTPASVMNCRDGASDCTGNCIPETGLCDSENVPEGTSCADGDACNGTDTCAAGVCNAHSGALDCADTDTCTTDTCDPSSGCLNMMIASCRACETSADCNDSNVCNGTETCEGGMCAAGTILSCDDGDECTTDTCAAPTTGCTHTAITSGACGGPADAGVDSGMVGTDGGVGTDSGVRTDAGVGTDAGSSDGSVTVDATVTITPRDTSGCGCRVAGTQTRGTPALLALGLLGLALVWRRRARR